MQSTKNAIILAAGMGSRLGMNQPKCLVEVHNKKIIDYQLELLRNFNDVRIVVGFKEEEVIDYVSKIRKDVVFVRNSQYNTTSNIFSAALATKHLTQPFFLLDGDVIINKNAFARFVKKCTESQDNIVGITETKTEEPVFVEVKNGYVSRFSVNYTTAYEWCGLAYFYNLKIESNYQGYIYKILEKNLPIKAYILEAYEIDTPYDYALAIKMLKDELY
jgi:choline kinase